MRSPVISDEPFTLTVTLIVTLTLTLTLIVRSADTSDKPSDPLKPLETDEYEEGAEPSAAPSLQDKARNRSKDANQAQVSMGGSQEGMSRRALPVPEEEWGHDDWAALEARG